MTGREMAVAFFLVRRNLAGISAAELHAAVLRVADTAAQMSREGHELRHLHSTYLADGFCACLFDAPSKHVVRLASERAAVPYDDISPATHLSGAGLRAARWPAADP
jgi:Protein of unknown function (DUF4242)